VACVKDNNLKKIINVQAVLKVLFAETLQSMLEAELDIEIGLREVKNQKNKMTRNSRKGTSRKTVTSECGEIEIQVPRNHRGVFEPMNVK